jgi:hypothetical protein
MEGEGLFFFSILPTLENVFKIELSVIKLLYDHISWL